MSDIILFSDKKTVNDLINEVEEKCFNIPFGMSKFQIENFVIAAQLTPERAYRQILLEIHGKLDILKNAKFDYEKGKINQDRAEWKLENEAYEDQFEKREVELDLKRAKVGLKYQAKLVNDLVVEIEIFYTHLQKYPEFTREEFEQGEFKFYEKKFNRAIELHGQNGALSSLLNMTEDKKRLDFITQEKNLLAEIKENG